MSARGTVSMTAVAWLRPDWSTTHPPPRARDEEAETGETGLGTPPRRLHRGGGHAQHRPAPRYPAAFRQVLEIGRVGLGSVAVAVPSRSVEPECRLAPRPRCRARRPPLHRRRRGVQDGRVMRKALGVRQGHRRDPGQPLRGRVVGCGRAAMPEGAVEPARASPGCGCGRGGLGPGIALSR